MNFKSFNLIGLNKDFYFHGRWKVMIKDISEPNLLRIVNEIRDDIQYMANLEAHVFLGELMIVNSLTNPNIINHLTDVICERAYDRF